MTIDRRVSPFGRLFGSRGSRRPGTCCLRLESLEDRTTPSLILSQLPPPPLPPAPPPIVVIPPPLTPPPPVVGGAHFTMPFPPISLAVKAPTHQFLLPTLPPRITPPAPPPSHVPVLMTPPPPPPARPTPEPATGVLACLGGMVVGAFAFVRSRRNSHKDAACVSTPGPAVGN